jgi:hypothetical protein
MSFYERGPELERQYVYCERQLNGGQKAIEVATRTRLWFANR